ncbi:MAG TPA: MFS transporter [Pseudonocardiaceae bacterium]
MGEGADATGAGRPRPLLLDPLAWHVTLFFGIQSMLFYAILAWLPSLYRDHGLSPATAGFLLSLAGLVQIPVTLLLPGIASRAADQVRHTVVATLLIGAGLAGILVAPLAAPYLWAVLVGVGTGAAFALALAMFVLRADQVADTARLSAMAQTVGYLISACGPLLVGLIHGLTGSWNPPLIVLLVLVVPLLWSGIRAGRAGVIGTRRVPAPADDHS